MLGLISCVLAFGPVLLAACQWDRLAALADARADLAKAETTVAGLVCAAKKAV